MDRFGDFIDIVLDGLTISKARRKELEDEIRDHLEMTKMELVEAGQGEEQAELEAIVRFGELKQVKTGLKSVFTPYRRIKDMFNEKKVLKECAQWAFTIIFALVISLSIRSYAFAQTEIRQESMQNTLFEGQRLVELKIGYYFSNPKRGDIVIINRNNEKGVIPTFISNTKEFINNFGQNQTDRNRLVKRVIGVPGDCIDIRDGKVYINGEPSDEPYVQGSTSAKDMKFPITIPENQYFVLGDNRENSMDSRDIGLIDGVQIEGEAVFRVWPLDKFGIIGAEQDSGSGGVE